MPGLKLRQSPAASVVPPQIQRLHQYYRDSLSQKYEFPGIGNYSPDFVRWALGSVDSVRLAELITPNSDSGMSSDHQLAFKLMLFTIQQANLALDANNNSPDYALAPGLVDGVRQGISRVLSLHPNTAYVITGAQLFYRIAAMADFWALAKQHAELFATTPILLAIMAFLHTLAGEYVQGLKCLQQLNRDANNRNLPLVALSTMTCRYFLGETPNEPVTFASLASGLNDLDDQIAQLAQLEMIQPLDRPVSCPVVFAACNDRYFYQHAVNLAASIHATNRGKLALHLHLYSPGQTTLDAIEEMRRRFPGLKIGVSVERGICPLPHPPSYFSTVRFVRAYQLLAYYKAELCIVDADAMFNRKWEDFLACFDSGAELGLACPRHAPFWEQVIAGVVYCKPTPLAENFLAKVAQFILLNLERKSVVWFTDQIALSACNDQFTFDNPAVSHVPADLLIDIHHHPLAPIWAVTTRKAGLRAYDEKREELGLQYGILPSADRAYLLSRVGRIKAPVFFLQIGAMDGASYDPIHAHVKAQGWHGILVEPLPDMMQRVRANYANHPGLIFENAAITEQEEARVMYRVPVESIQESKLPYWLAGMSTFVPGKLDEFKAHVVEQTVSCLPLKSLLAKHNPAKIDVLQIDAEGYDYTILKQFDFSRYQPSIVNFECVNLSAEERSLAELLLHKHGYLFYQEDQDLFAFKLEAMFSGEYPAPPA